MQFPSWLQWYKKPEFQDINKYSIAVAKSQRPLTADRRAKSNIPSKLKLSRILENKTCSPMSLYDFYMYLKYVEFSVENLEFYVWYKNYERSYAKNGDFHTSKTADNVSINSSIAELNPTYSEANLAEAIELDHDSEIARETLSRITAFLKLESACSASSNGVCKPLPNTIADIPGANSLQRAELIAVVQTFIVDGSPKELNIPEGMRHQAIANLQTSSNPVYLKPIAEHVYQLLYNCSHRNFVRLGVSNGTIESICMATSLGIAMVLAGFLYMFLHAFYPFRGSHSRWDAIAAFPLWWIGMSLILAGLRGSCFFLLLFSRRQLLPWERFDDDNSTKSQSSRLLKRFSRLMIIDRKIKIKDEHLRKLQKKIVAQSLVGGAMFGTIGVLLFIFLPVWQQTVVI